MRKLPLTTGSGVTPRSSQSTDRPGLPSPVEACTNSRPELSVVIASSNPNRMIEACLESLRRQTTSRPFEIILVDSSSDGTAEMVRQRYPQVQLIHVPSRLFCGDARNVGVQAARADIIAFLDTDCSVESHWVESVIRAQIMPHLLVSGIVENATTTSRIAWAYYFCEFSHWLPRAKALEVPEAAGCCLSLKRTAYETYGPFLQGTYSSDSAFQWRALKDGHKVYLDPSIRVFHGTLYGFREYLSHVAFHRRCYARVRMKERGLGLVARLGRIALTPALPLLLVVAIAARVAQSRGVFREFLACLPVLLAGLSARAWGEFLGFAITERN